jgi:hypothetical protein
MRSIDPDGRNADHNPPWDYNAPIVQNYPTYSQWTPDIQNSRVQTFICPSDYTQRPDLRGYASYALNGQVFKHAYPYWGSSPLTFPSSITDGTSNTIFFADKLAQCQYGNYNNNYWPDWGPIVSSSEEGDPTGTAAIFQVQPTGSPPNCDGGRASSPHIAGINVALADGSCRFVAKSISPTTWWWALTPMAGEVLGNDWSP